MDALVSSQAFHDQLATSIHYGNRNGGLMYVHADILFLTHKGAPFARLVIRTITTYRKSGRLFILRAMGMLRQLEDEYMGAALHLY